MDLFDNIEIDGIQYEMNKMNNIEYSINKMNEYANKVGFLKANRSQKFIRHLHICIALNLHKRLKIPKENIHFEVKLKNKNIDVGVIEDNRIKVAISIRSQSSSIKKNFTNNVNSLQGEVVGLKSFYPNLTTAVVYLFKRYDIETGDDCLDYYNNNIPKKMLPIISSINNNDRFDVGCILIWDYDDINKNIKLENNQITNPYNFDNFYKDLDDLYNDTMLKSAFNVDDLDINKLKKFLGST